MTESRTGKLAPRASKAARSARRKLATWAAKDLNAELRDTRRELKETKIKLRDVRAKLRDARAQLAESAHELPPEIEDVIARAREEHLTYLKPGGLRDLASIVLELERDGLPGLVIEAGTARGGSAIVMAAAKDPQRPMKVYDVFGMIPPPTEQDGQDVHARYAKIAGGEARGVGGETYYGYRDDLYQEVVESFARLGVPVADNAVELVRGLFEDTIVIDEPVAFAHLDGDWYESTLTCLERIAPHVVPGGRIVLDDYYKWSGCRAAVDEYFGAHAGFRLEHRAKLHAIRT